MLVTFVNEGLELFQTCSAPPQIGAFLGLIWVVTQAIGTGANSHELAVMEEPCSISYEDGGRWAQDHVGGFPLFIDRGGPMVSTVLVFEEDVDLARIHWAYAFAGESCLFSMPYCRWLQSSFEETVEDLHH